MNRSLFASSSAMILGNLGVVGGGFLIVALLPDIRRELHLSATEAGLLISIYAITYAISSPLLGWAGTRLPYRLVLITATLIAAAGCLMAAHADGPGFFMASRVVAAFGAALFTPTAAAFAVSINSPEHRGKALSTVALGVSLSQVIALPAASLVNNVLGWRSAFTIAGGFLVMVALLLRLVAPGHTRPPKLSLNVFRAALLNRRLMANASLTALFSGACNMIYAFQAEIFIANAGLTASTLGVVLLCLGVGTLAGTWVAGRAIDLVGASKTLTGQAVMIAIICVPMTSLHYSFSAACVIAVIAGGSLFTHIAPLQMRLIRLMPAGSGMIFSINASFIYVGSAIGSLASGGIVDTFGLEWLGPSAVAVVAAGLIYMRFLDRLAARQKEIV
ncbi:MFS transporter [Oryzicola mucosus]|uniref:MFS transporter n=1 Tax=Oryzicola mucosus TaxID=2767425 RepID=A0A8J6PW66_9HYPH|nr:MFS transporter [Oryzicola mucosus]MBD0417344.1 MFS transporter [Oryzicola mucosus]